MISFKLSVKNIRKHIQDYTVYFFTLVLSVAVFYMFNSLDSQGIIGLVGEQTYSYSIEMITSMMYLISILVLGIFALLLLYANRFLMKRRKREFALYQLLGMERSRISRMLLCETLLIGVLSLAVGLLIGIVGSQLLSIIVANLFEADMSAYTFSFSSLSLFLTIFCFTLIYLPIIFLNTLHIHHSRLISLLSASKQNEGEKPRSLWLSLIAFVSAVALLAFAYYRVAYTPVTMLDIPTLGYMILFGVIATFLLFWALSGFILRIALLFRKWYFHKLNSFILREFYAKIHTAVFSMSIICLLLFFTICIFASAISYSSFSTENLRSGVPCDVEIAKVMNLRFDTEIDADLREASYLSVMESLQRDGLAADSLKSIVETNVYLSDLSWEDMLTPQTLEQLYDNGAKGIDSTKQQIMEVSDYNKLAKLFRQEAITLGKDQYAIAANVHFMISLRNNALQQNLPITLNGQTLTPAYDHCIFGSVSMNSSYTNSGVLIVPDGTMRSDQLAQSVLFADYPTSDKLSRQEAENELFAFVEQARQSKAPFYYDMETRISIYSSGLGVGMMLTFVALYLGIVSLISCAAVLSLKQLADCSDNKERYAILRKLGVEEAQIRRTLLCQMAIFFGAPLLLACVHAVFGLRFCHAIISMTISGDFYAALLPTAALLLIVYGGYFFLTYLCSCRMIRERD